MASAANGNVSPAICPGCSNQPTPGFVPTPSGQLWQNCPLCTGQGYPPGVWPGAGKAEFYTLDFALTANQTQLGTLLIRTGTDFLWKFPIAKKTGNFTFALDQNGNQYQTSFSVQAAGSVQIQGIMQDVNFWGTGQEFMPLPDPIPLGEQTRLNVSITDISGANNTINLLFVGAEFPAGTLVTQGRNT